MPCPNCDHSWPLHGEHGCSVPNCDCRQQKPMDSQAIVDLPPAKPGACVHMPDGDIHILDAAADFHEKLKEASPDEWIEVTWLAFHGPKQYTMRHWIKPSLVGRFHEISDAGWASVLKEHGIE